MLDRPATSLPPVPTPDFGEELAAVHPSRELSDFLLRRRSTKIACLTEPGPGPDSLARMLTAAARVPDHGKLAPWRFVLFDGDARAQFGTVIADAFVKTNPDAKEDMIEAERGRFLRAPLVVAVISSPRVPHKIPEWEQVLSVGAVCQNLLLAGQAEGFAGLWLTEWYAFDPTVMRALGLQYPERVAGFLYFGTAKEPPLERVRPELDTLVSRWSPARERIAAPTPKAPSA